MQAFFDHVLEYKDPAVVRELTLFFRNLLGMNLKTITLDRFKLQLAKHTTKSFNKHPARHFLDLVDPALLNPSTLDTQDTSSKGNNHSHYVE